MLPAPISYAYDVMFPSKHILQDHFPLAALHVYCSVNNVTVSSDTYSQKLTY